MVDKVDAIEWLEEKINNNSDSEISTTIEQTSMECIDLTICNSPIAIKRKELDSLSTDKLSIILDDICKKNNLNNYLDIFCIFKSGKGKNFPVVEPFTSFLQFKNVVLRTNYNVITLNNIYLILNKINPGRIKSEIISTLNNSGIVYIQDLLKHFDDKFNLVCYSDFDWNNNLTLRDIISSILWIWKKNITKQNLLDIIDILDLKLNLESSDTNVDNLLNPFFEEKKIKFIRKNFTDEEVLGLVKSALDRNEIFSVFDLLFCLKLEKNIWNFSPFASLESMIQQYLQITSWCLSIGDKIEFSEAAGFDYIESEMIYMLKEELNIKIFDDLLEYWIDNFMSYEFKVGITWKKIISLLFSKSVIDTLVEPITLDLKRYLDIHK